MAEQSSIILHLHSLKDSIKSAFKVFEDIDIQCQVEEIKQNHIKLVEENKQQQEPKYITLTDQKRVLNNFDNIICQLQLVTPFYSDQKYLTFESSDKNKRQTQLKNQQMWDQIKQEQKERFAKYQDETILDKIFQLDTKLKEDYEYSLQYMSGNQKKTIQIKFHDIQKLNPPNYLNDGIINFYLKFIEFELIEQSLRSKTYIFNTYFVQKLCFFEKLQMIGQNDHLKLNELFKLSYEQIKKWIKEDLTEKEYLLFPINLPEHWSLLIVHKKTKSFADSVIIYLDSFGIMDQKLITIIKMYLHKINCDVNSIEINYNDSPIKLIPAYQLLVPRQVNYVDCGAFLLEYAESFLSNPNYLLQDVESQDGIYKLKLFPRSLICNKRLLMKQLLIDLLEFDKDIAISQYQQKRQAIIDQCKNDEDEYDQIDQVIFKEFINQKNQMNIEQRQLLLDFYMNPQQNYYQQ
ncbi:unnamed protein product [Paramecium primaurelia]|uniref:Ubiquitin-like protease family profile domain-containing protein n=1 Tax=Paramecium primaurelia TaxID=5886 RepID=A0A8S1Q5B5_PARPR|nr:unnamed protein product [Paramecium primaurelia]